MLDFDTTKINLGLERVLSVMQKMGNPHLKYPTIHVAGTNGKGSVCAMLDSILRQAGYKVGLFTSPHLIKWNERIKVGGVDISDEDFLRMKSEILNSKSETNPNIEIPNSNLTPFEVITCLAFEYFAEKKIDIAVVEVGMGGRMDATNVLKPILTIITNIDYDHTEYLGNSLAEIAYEKAGIIKDGVPVLTAESKAEPLEVIRKAAKERKAPLEESRTSNVEYRIMNNEVVMQAVRLVRQQGYSISDQQVEEGISQTRWPGRFQIVSQNPLTILDGAHNPAGARALRVMIENLKLKLPLTLILGVQSTKNISAMLDELLPLASRVIVTRSEHPLAAEPQKLISNPPLADESRISNIEVAETVNEAIKRAQSYGKEQVILVTGSLYVVGEALKCFEDL